MERTWEPRRGETIHGTWRASRGGGGGDRRALWAPPYVETDDGDRLLLPSHRSLNAQLRSLQPSDGLRLTITYEGADGDGEEIYVVTAGDAPGDRPSSR